MSSKKQTAVEWLMEHITYDNDYGERWASFKECTDLNIYFQKALAMEKEQIQDAFYFGIEVDESKVHSPYKAAEDYYTSTYE